MPYLGCARKIIVNKGLSPVPPPVPLHYPVSTGGEAMRMMKDAQRPTRAETPPVRIEAWLEGGPRLARPSAPKIRYEKRPPPVHILRYIDTLFPLTAK